MSFSFHGLSVYLLQALPYVCLLIAILFFIYAIIGMQVTAVLFEMSFNITVGFWKYK